MVAFGEASAANNSGGILVNGLHKRVILYVCLHINILRGVVTAVLVASPLKDRCQLVTFCHPGLTYTFLISDIRALWRSGLSARVPECKKLKMYRLDLDGNEHF